MKNAPILVSRKEMYFGWRYLAFQAVFLGYFLYRAAGLLGWQLDSLTLNFLYFCVNFVVCLLCFRKFLRISLQDAAGKLPRILLTAAGVFCIYNALLTLVGLLIAAIDPDFANINDQNIASISQDNFLLTAVGTVLLVPLAEEVLHRGVVFGSIYRRSRVAAYLVSTVLFSLIHISGYIGTVEPLTLLLCFAQYVPAGLCLAAGYELSGSILTPILIHTAVNAMGIFAMR